MNPIYSAALALGAVRVRLEPGGGYAVLLPAMDSAAYALEMIGGKTAPGRGRAHFFADDPTEPIEALAARMGTRVPNFEHGGCRVKLSLRSTGWSFREITYLADDNFNVCRRLSISAA